MSILPSKNFNLFSTRALFSYFYSKNGNFAELRMNKDNSRVLIGMKVISTRGISRRILENIDFRNLGLEIIVLDN